MTIFVIPGKHYPKVQILTIKEILDGHQIKYPRVSPDITYKRAEYKGKDNKREQGKLDL